MGNGVLCSSGKASSENAEAYHISEAIDRMLFDYWDKETKVVKLLLLGGWSLTGQPIDIIGVIFQGRASVARAPC